jgi:DNA-binding transcriptional LysR family regulator
VRGRRGVYPTPVGQSLVHHARLVLQQMERMRGELGEYAYGLKGHIRLLCNTAAISEFLPEALATFMAQHPNVDIDLEERLSYDIVRAVGEGLADVGIVADSVDLSGLETFAFRLDRLVVVVAADDTKGIGAKQEHAPCVEH